MNLVTPLQSDASYPDSLFGSHRNILARLHISSDRHLSIISWLMVLFFDLNPIVPPSAILLFLIFGHC